MKKAEKVQKKYYLPEALALRVKVVAAKAHMRESEIVEWAIRGHLIRQANGI